MKILTLALSLLVGSPIPFLLNAQEPQPPQPRPQPVHISPTVPRVSVSQIQASSAPETPPTENYSIALTGGFLEGVPLNIELTGAGPKFTISIPDPQTAFEILIGTPQENQVAVTYTLSFQVQVKTGNNNIQYQSSTLSGTALLTLGKPLRIASVNGKELSLLVARYPGGAKK